jgi:hypothetical protein
LRLPLPPLWTGAANAGNPWKREINIDPPYVVQ